LPVTQVRFLPPPLFGTDGFTLLDSHGRSIRFDLPAVVAGRLLRSRRVPLRFPGSSLSCNDSYFPGPPSTMILMARAAKSRATGRRHRALPYSSTAGGFFLRSPQTGLPGCSVTNDERSVGPETVPDWPSDIPRVAGWASFAFHNAAGQGGPLMYRTIVGACAMIAAP
jgi:hypothetical protein